MEGDIVTKSLNMRFSDAETKIGSIQTELNSARKGKTALVDKIDEIDTDISNLWGNIGTINTTFNEASNSAEYGINHGSVRARLEYDEDKLHNVEDEIKNAHSSDAFNRKYKSSVLDDSFLTLDARFEEGESRIVALETASGNLNSDKVSYDDIVANLTTNDDNKPLAAS
jgi:chromosome segregation ATPase